MKGSHYWNLIEDVCSDQGLLGFPSMDPFLIIITNFVRWWFWFIFAYFWLLWWVSMSCWNYIIWFPGSLSFGRLVGGPGQNSLWPNSVGCNLEQHLFCGFGGLAFWVPNQNFWWTEGYISAHADCKNLFLIFIVTVVNVFLPFLRVY